MCRIADLAGLQSQVCCSSFVYHAVQLELTAKLSMEHTTERRPEYSSLASVAEKDKAPLAVTCLSLERQPEVPDLPADIFLGRWTDSEMRLVEMTVKSANDPEQASMGLSSSLPAKKDSRHQSQDLPSSLAAANQAYRKLAEHLDVSSKSLHKPGCNERVSPAPGSRSIPA